jgi:hypothetical protein
VSNFPDAQRTLRRASLLLALRRYVVDEAARRKQRLHFSQRDGDMIDAVHAAAGKITDNKQATSVQMALELVNNVDERTPHNESDRPPSEAVEHLKEAIVQLSAQQAAMMALAQGTQEQVARLHASVAAITEVVNGGAQTRTDACFPFAE